MPRLSLAGVALLLVGCSYSRSRPLHEAAVGVAAAPTVIVAARVEVLPALPSSSSLAAAERGLWDDSVGDPFGEAGLELSGTGAAGRPPGGSETLYGGWELGGALGVGSWHLRRPKSPQPRVRMSTPDVNGELPREIVQRVVRQSFGRFRLCYEQALALEPTLSGGLTVEFTIDSQGRVKGVTTSGDMPANMAPCITPGFVSLQFPQPEVGTVSVKFRLTFSRS